MFNIRTLLLFPIRLWKGERKISIVNGWKRAYQQVLELRDREGEEVELSTPLTSRHVAFVPRYDPLAVALVERIRFLAKDRTEVEYAFPFYFPLSSHLKRISPYTRYTNRITIINMPVQDSDFGELIVRGYEITVVSTTKIPISDRRIDARVLKSYVGEVTKERDEIYKQFRKALKGIRGSSHPYTTIPRALIGRQLAIELGKYLATGQPLKHFPRLDELRNLRDLQQALYN